MQKRQLYMLQAQAHYPLVDVHVVKEYLDKLGQECKQRVAEAELTAADVGISDLDRLKILNNLMFGAPADGRY